MSRADFDLAVDSALDMEVVARRIVELAQVAVEEHVAAIGRSQADGLMAMGAEIDAEERTPLGKWRS